MTLVEEIEDCHGLCVGLCSIGAALLEILGECHGLCVGPYGLLLFSAGSGRFARLLFGHARFSRLVS